MKYFLSLFLFFTQLVNAQNAYDILAFPKYEQVAIDHIPNGSKIGFFDSTFGDASKSIEKYLSKKATPLIRVNLIWSDTHSFGDADIPTIKKRSRYYQQLKKRFPNTIFEIAPFTEHNLQNPDKYLQIVKNNCPDCVPVNSVWKGALSKKFKNEVHDNRQVNAPCNFSFDGNSANDADVETAKNKFKHCENFFVWTARFNGKKNDKDPTPRPQRVDWPKKEHIEAMTWLLGAKGNASLPTKWISKPMADYHGQGDIKGDKLLIIAPVKVPEIQLRKGADIIHKLKYYGTYEKTQHRYYAYEWGYKIAAKCKGVCDVYAAQKKIGSINAGFRQNEYRGE